MTTPVPIANMLALPLFDTWAVVDSEWSLEAYTAAYGESRSIIGGGAMEAVDYELYTEEGGGLGGLASPGDRIVSGKKNSLSAAITSSSFPENEGQGVGRALQFNPFSPHSSNAGVGSVKLTAAFSGVLIGSVIVPIYTLNPAEELQWVTVPADKIEWDVVTPGTTTITGSVRCRVQRLR